MDHLLALVMAQIDKHRGIICSKAQQVFEVTKSKLKGLVGGSPTGKYMAKNSPRKWALLLLFKGIKIKFFASLLT